MFLTMRCFRNVKDKNFESDSQQKSLTLKFSEVVSVTSKIRILKAIHNHRAGQRIRRSVVSVTSKIRILKAIHNRLVGLPDRLVVVSVTSKIRILKAIHNFAG